MEVILNLETDFISKGLIYECFLVFSEWLPIFVVSVEFLHSVPLNSLTQR